MSELGNLYVRIKGDSSDLKSQLDAAQKQLDAFKTKVDASGKAGTAATSAFGKLGDTLKGNTSKIQLISFQLQDLAVQLAGGTKASVAFAQQGPQIASAFGAIGAAVGVLIAVGLPLLSYLFSDAGEKATTLAEDAENLRSAMDALDRDVDLAGQSLEELGKKAGSAAIILRDFTLSRINDDIYMLGQQMKGLSGELQVTLEDFVGATVVMDEFGQHLDVSEQIRNVAEELNIGRLEAVALQDALTQLAQAKNTNQMVAAVQAFDAAMKAANLTTSDLSPLIQAAVASARDLASAGIEAAAALARAKAAQSGQDIGLPLFNNPDAMGNLTPPGAGSSTSSFKAPGGGGGGGKDPIIAALASVQKALSTQEELQQQSYERQQATLEEALQKRLITQQEYSDLMERAENTHQFAMTQSAHKGVSDVLGAFGQLFSGSKEIGAGIALVNAWMAFSETLKDPAFVGRPWARFAAAAKALASGLSAVRGIKSASRGGGGSTSAAVSSAPTHSQNVAIQLVGGSMYSRDQVITLINEINKAAKDGARIRLVS